MSLQAVANFLILYSDRGVEGRYQNGKVEGAIVLEGQNFFYLPFIYQGATITRSGDNLQSTITMAVNTLAMNIAHQAVEGDYQVELQTWAMDPSTFNPGKQLTHEYWIAAGLAYDPDALQIQLSSPIDAVGAQVPNRVLTTKLVGALPVTASVRNV